MEKLNKRIMSSLLATSLALGITTGLKNEAQAKDDDVVVITEADAANMDLVEICHMKGIYNVVVNNVPVYVYLNNKVDNEYLLKNDAVELAKKSYNTDKVYFYSKVVQSPNYVEGFTPEEERYNFVYALSDKTSVEGWTRVADTNVITSEELVASSIELGEFILKEVDLSRFFLPASDPLYTSVGYGYVDVNHDGVMSEVVYIGNNDNNMLVNKDTAVTMINDSKGKIKVFEKKVTSGTMVALSEKAPGNGWKQVNINNVSKTKQIGTSVEYMDAMYHVASTTVTTEKLYFPKLDNNVNAITTDPVGPQTTINILSKAEALTWASTTYAGRLFCILQKEYVDKNTGLATKVYAISTDLSVEGYDFAFDDNIPSNAMICLSVADAENYIATYGKAVTKSLS